MLDTPYQGRDVQRAGGRGKDVVGRADPVIANHLERSRDGYEQLMALNVCVFTANLRSWYPEYPRKTRRTSNGTSLPTSQATSEPRMSSAKVS